MPSVIPATAPAHPRRSRWRSGLLAGLALAGLACLSPRTGKATDDVAAPTLTPTLTVDGGAIRGQALPDGGAMFQGIPFAAPPLGALRWQPPQPVPAWTGVRDATRPAASCLQRSYGWNKDDAAHGAEDCLYLNVRTPRLDPQARLPVMVWIHGGANWAGSARGVVQSTITRRGVVLVALQYRLDVFGFLSHPDLTAQSSHHASGNYGLMDQIAALRWVRENITRFGGDPDAVTIFGESAGGQDVGQLLLSPQARGLFTRAIEESGTAGFGQPPRALAENEQLGVTFVDHLGVPAGPGAIDALRALPADRLLAAGATLIPPAIEDPSFLWLQATVDGWVLPEAPAAALAARHQAAVPLLIGSNARELTLHGGDGPDNVRRWITRAYGDRAAQALAAYGPLDGPGDPRLGSLGDQVANDLTFRCPALTVAAHQAATGAPVWVYHFDRGPRDAQDHPDSIHPQGHPGSVHHLGHPARVTHGSDLRFIFEDLPAGPDSAPDSASVQAYWVNFARTGNPNGPGLPTWPAFREADGDYLIFSENGPREGSHLRGGLCDLLDRP